MQLYSVNSRRPFVLCPLLFTFFFSFFSSCAISQHACSNPDTVNAAFQTGAAAAIASIRTCHPEFGIQKRGRRRRREEQRWVGRREQVVSRFFIAYYVSKAGLQTTTWRENCRGVQRISSISRNKAPSLDLSPLPDKFESQLTIIISPYVYPRSFRAKHKSQLR